MNFAIASLLGLRPRSTVRPLPRSPKREYGRGSPENVLGRLFPDTQQTRNQLAMLHSEKRRVGFSPLRGFSPATPERG